MALLTMRCSDDDLGRWKARADGVGVSLSSLIRSLLDGGQLSELPHPVAKVKPPRKVRPVEVIPDIVQAVKPASSGSASSALYGVDEAGKPLCQRCGRTGNTSVTRICSVCNP